MDKKSGNQTATKPEASAASVVPFPSDFTPKPKQQYSKADSRFWMKEGALKKPGRSVNWTARIQHAGRRELMTLNTANKTAAATKAAELYRRITTEGWDVVAAERNPTTAPTVATTIGAVVVALEGVDLRPRSIINYATALRWWGARHLEARPGRREFSRDNTAWRDRINAVALADLTTARVEAIRDAHIKRQAKGGAEFERRSRVSVKSYLRNARAALHAVRKLVTLPETLPFEGVTVERAYVPSYRATVDFGTLFRALVAQPDVGIRLTVALGMAVGQRKAEVLNLVWRNVDRERGLVYVGATRGWSPKTEGSAGPVTIDKTLLELLEPHRGKPEESVVNKRAYKRALGWLRAQGVTGGPPKTPLQECRKMFGSAVLESSDLITASKQLRHSNIAITAAVYVDVRKRKPAPVTEWMNPEEGR